MSERKDRGRVENCRQTKVQNGKEIARRRKRGRERGSGTEGEREGEMESQ